MAYGEEAKAGVIQYIRAESRTTLNKSVKVQLRANVHDALWMLSRQYDVGEFKGENAGSAIKSVVTTTTKSINKFKNQNGVCSFDNLELLEPKAEKLAIKIDIMARLQMGKYWNKLLKQAGFYSANKDMIMNEFSFSETSLNEFETELVSCNANIQQINTIINGNLLDGWNLYLILKSNGTIDSYNAISIVGQIGDFNLLENLYLNWVEKTYLPTGVLNENKAWKPENLEYDFECSVQENNNPSSTDQTVLIADEYQAGNLDWYSFNLPKTPINHGDNSTTDNHSTTTKEFLPSKIEFKGAMSSRWWEFDDAIINLNDIKSENYNITKILTSSHLINFSHDWQIIPLEVPIGTLVEIDSITVLDVFGDEISISQIPASTNWNMFTLNEKGDLFGSDIEGRLFLPPVVAKRIESKAVEEVLFMRDEMANMVWGIEKVIPDVFFGGADGGETATMVMKYYEENDSTLEPDINGQIKSDASQAFKLSDVMPENWIPLVPVKRDASNNREIEFQRATFYRIINGKNTLETIRPKTNLLLADGDKLPETPTPYFIKEEEILRNGIIVRTTYQRARDYNGSVKTWLGREKRNNKSQKSSDFKFDVTKPFDDSENSNVSLNQWNQKTDLPSVLVDAAVFLIGDYIYIVGGTDGTDLLNGVSAYDIQNDSWAAKTDWLPSGDGRRHCQGCSLDGKGYVFGGESFDGANYSWNNELYEYNPSTDAWSEIPCSSTPNARADAVLFGFDGKLYYGLGRLGDIGDPATVYKKDLWEFDFGTNNWSQKSSPDSNISSAANFIIDDKIYFIGGYNENEENNECVCYNPSGDSWQTLASLPIPSTYEGIYSLAGFTINGYGHIVCGCYSASEFSSSLWLYNPTVDAWMKRGDFEGANRLINGLVVNTDTNAYVIGGIDEHQVLLNEVWEYSF